MTDLQRLIDASKQLNRINEEGVFVRLNTLLLGEILNELRCSNGKPEIDLLGTRSEELFQTQHPAAERDSHEK